MITKGDNNNAQDQNLVSLQDVEGIYVLRIPGVGSMMKSLSEPTTITILVLGITILFGVGFMISNKKQQALERQEFLEYKRMKELEENESKTKKTKSIKAEEESSEEDNSEDEEEEDDESEETSSKKKSSNNSHKKSSKKTKSK